MYEQGKIAKGGRNKDGHLWGGAYYQRECTWYLEQTYCCIKNFFLHLGIGRAWNQAAWVLSSTSNQLEMLTTAVSDMARAMNPATHFPSATATSQTSNQAAGSQSLAYNMPSGLKDSGPFSVMVRKPECEGFSFPCLPQQHTGCKAKAIRRELWGVITLARLALKI